MRRRLCTLAAAASFLAACTGTPSPLAPTLRGSIGVPHEGMITDAIPLPKKGEGYAKACATCHNFEKGGAAKVGPPLYGVLNRPVASLAGFDYSDALKKKGGTWSFDEIFKFIGNPKGDVPGTKMGYAGEKDAQRRADIEAYLRSLADSPAPLPATN